MQPGRANSAANPKKNLQIRGSLVDPEDWFDPWNVRIHGIIHGIDAQAVEGNPTLPGVRAELHDRLSGTVVVSHSSFDRIAVGWALSRYGFESLQAVWLDSTRVVRRAWPERYAKRGYGLRNVTADLGIEFRHHDALEDARAAAEIVLRACEATGLGIEDWLSKVGEPIATSAPRKRDRRERNYSSVKRQGDVDGPLHGEVITFTGALSMPRPEAADLAARAGCKVVTAVTKKLTFLVVGVQDRNRLKGYEKSGKHRQVEG